MNSDDSSKAFVYFPKVARVSVAKAIETLLEMPDVRQTVVYQHPKMVVKATRQHKRDARERQFTILVTMGEPNYRERKFVAACQKAAEPFPVRKVQLRGWPKPRVRWWGVDSSR